MHAADGRSPFPQPPRREPRRVDEPQRRRFVGLGWAAIPPACQSPYELDILLSGSTVVVRRPAAKLVSPAQPLRKHGRHLHSRAHSPPPHRPLRAGLVRCHRHACRHACSCRCRMRPLPMSALPHEVTAGQAQPLPLLPPPLSQPSAACTPFCDRQSPSSSALAGAPAGVGLSRLRGSKERQAGV